MEERILLTAGNGLQAHYFDTPDLTGPALVRLDAGVDFDWAAGSPDASIANDTFSARWAGQVESQFTETYSFILNANDGARLWVNGQLLIDQFDSSSLSDETATIDLIAGRRYDIQLEFRENTGNASVSLEWSSASLTREVIPTNRLYAADRGSIVAEQWDAISGATVASLTADADFPQNPDSVSSLNLFEATSNSADNFGQRLHGYLHAPVTGPYTFYIAGDESAELWLSNTGDPDAKELIAEVTSATAPREWDASAGQKSAVIYLTAGQSYYIEALHKEAVGTDHLAVGWQVPGDSDINVIAGEHLSPVVPTVKIYAQAPRVAEGSGAKAQFTIVRSGGPLNNPLTVNYSTLGDAINGTDYTLLPGSITIPAGADSVTLEIEPTTDAAIEGDESATIELLAGPGYNVGFKSQRTAYGTVQDDTSAPAGGASLWTGNSLSDFSERYGGTYSTQTDPTFGNVIQAVIPSGLPSQFSAQMGQSIDSPVNVGDILFVEFYIKSIGGPGEVVAVFEINGAPYTKSLSQGIPISENWSKVQLPFYAAETYATGAARFGFQLGSQGQTLQFANLQLLNYGQPKSLAPETGLNVNNVAANPGDVYGTGQIVPVTGQPFDFAFEAQTTNVPPAAWRFQSVDRNDAGVSNGNTMQIKFYARSVAGAAPQMQFVIQETTNYATLFSQAIPLTTNWLENPHVFNVPVTQNFAPNGLQIVFITGHSLQTVQIGGLTWENAAATVDLADLPQQFPAATYGGREGTAAWRDDADGRIDAERKSSVTVNVTDDNGQPLDGAVVSIRQNNHDFKFGSAINAYNGKLDVNGNATALKYQAEIERLFNTVVFENSLKWPGYQQDPQRAIDGVQWAHDRDFYIRGHNIVWPSRRFMPSNIWTEYDSRLASDGKVSADAWMKTTIEAHFDDVLAQFDGQIPEWDVVNEPFSEHDVMDLFATAGDPQGTAILLEWFQRVRDYDPTIQLTLNDYAIFSNNGGNTAHRANFEFWLQTIEDAGLLDVIGEQSHYNDASLTDIDVLAGLINTYNSLPGFSNPVPIAITEFDVNSTDEQLQADYLRDYLTQSFSQPAVEQFLHWGFWQNSHWLPDAALYRTDFSVKPNGQAYEDLVFGDWWSDVQGTTRSGAVTADVFQGDYDIVVEYNGVSYAATLTVDDSGTSSLTVNVPVDPVNYDPVVDVDNASVSGVVLGQFANTGTWGESENESVNLTASLGAVQQNGDGTWSWSFIPEQRYVNQSVTITATDARGGEATVSFLISADTDIVLRGIGYGNSSVHAENEMPTGVVALLPGQTATAANFTNYTSGLNRVIIEVAGLASSSLSASDFEFRVGNTDDPADWLVLDGNGTGGIPLPTISVQPTAIAGVDQIMLSWLNNVIENTWLQVTIQDTANTGLNAPDTFYFGNQVGDVNGDVNVDNRIRVNSFDTGLVRLNQSPVVTVGIDHVYDVDRNGLVNSFDTGRIRLNQSLGGLLMFTAPLVAPPSAGLVSAPPETISSAVIAPNTIRQSQVSYLSRLRTRWENRLNESLTTERAHTIIVKRLKRVAQRSANAAEQFASVGDFSRSNRRTEVSLILSQLAEQVEATSVSQVSDIFSAFDDWTDQLN